MGLSFKPLKKIVQGVERQVNPFDNGATYNNAAPAHPNGTPPSLLHQAGSFVNNNIVKPVAQFPIDASAQLYSHVVAPTLNLPGLSPGQTSLNPTVQAAANKVGATGSLHQTIGSGIQTGLTLAAPGADSLLEAGAARVLPKTIPALVPKVVSNATIGAGFNSAAAASQGQKPGQIVKAGLEGAALGGAVPLIRPVLKSSVKLAAKTPSVVVDQYRAVNPGLPPVAETPPVEPPQATAAPVATPAEKVMASVKTQNAPQALITPTKLGAAAKTGVPEIDKAIQDVKQNYNTPAKFSGGIQDVVKQAGGQSTVGARAANNLRIALTKHLSKDENAQVSDILDNHPGANLGVSDKVLQVSKALKPLQDTAYDVRKAINPNINRVQDYVTRLPTQAVGDAIAKAGTVLGKVKNLSDITNLRSVFNENRKVGKFIGPDGNPVYGNSTKLGLVNKGEGKFVDDKGNTFKPVAVSKRELEENGAGKYEHNIGRISGIYHADTASLKARAEAMQHLKGAPEKMGLQTAAERSADSVPIHGVPELDGMYASAKDAKAINDAFGYHTPTGVAGKAYDAISNVATQSIVLNPFFHGMNQLYQTGIAAGNIPGMGTGWVKVAQAAANVSEQDIRDYLAAGGHSPDYGAHQEGVISHLTGGLSKVNTKTLAAIELKFRSGLYKASIDAGMKPADAVANIDRYLGDSSHTDAAVRRFTLFYHYFKTMAGAIGHQVAHPIEEKGAIMNAASLAAITAAVTYGYQKFTGNKNAYVRVPGELGLVKEGVQNAEGLAKGDVSKATSIVTNRLNPVLKEGIQQGVNKDFFTGQQVGNSVKEKAGHAVSSILAPAQIIQKGAQGRRNVAELAGNQVGLYEPHAKGYQTTSNKAVSFLNTPKALPGNGVAAQNAYFNGLKTAQKELSSDKKATASLNNYLAKSKDPATGQNIQNSPAESQQNSSSLFANDKLRNTVQKFEKSQPSHDPIWDLPPDKLKTLMQYKEQFTGDAAKKFLAQQNPWIQDVQNKSEAFYNNLPKIPGSKGSEASSQTPTYPSFDKGTQSLLDQYDTLEPKDQSTLIKNNPGLVDAFAQISDWTNKMRNAEGAPALKQNVQADPGTQKIIDFYNNLPTHDGKKGGNATRSAWITANPAAYKQMTDFYTQASLQSLIKNAAVDQFQGSQPDQQLLKSIYSLGQYDVTKGSNGVYALGGSAGNSVGGSSSGYSSSSSSSNAAYKDARYLSNASKFTVAATTKKASKGKLSVKKVSLKPSVKSKTGGSKVTIKHSLV